MNTIFRKVSVSERLPNISGDYFVFSKYNKSVIIKSVEFILVEKGFFDYGESEYADEKVTHWLQEVELPTDEEIEGFSFSYRTTIQRGEGFIRGAKFIRDNVLG